MAPSWNPATELQAIGRSHRTGQTKQVYIKKFVYNDVSEDLPSIEQALICLQGTKSEICSEVLNDIRLREQVPKNLHGTQITLKEIVKIFVF
jgi:SNF2 family DNA or RNA helicase